MLDIIGQTAMALRLQGKPRIAIPLPVSVNRKTENLKLVWPGGVKPTASRFHFPRQQTGENLLSRHRAQRCEAHLAWSRGRVC